MIVTSSNEALETCKKAGKKQLTLRRSNTRHESRYANQKLPSESSLKGLKCVNNTMPPIPPYPATQGRHVRTGRLQRSLLASSPAPCSEPGHSMKCRKWGLKAILKKYKFQMKNVKFKHHSMVNIHCVLKSKSSRVTHAIQVVVITVLPNTLLFNRPGVAGAVLQTHLSLIH